MTLQIAVLLGALLNGQESAGTTRATCPDNMDLVPAMRCTFSVGSHSFDLDGAGRLRRLSGPGGPREVRVPVPHGTIYPAHFAAFENDLLLVYESGDLEGGAGVVARLDGKTLAVKWHLPLPAFNVSLGTIEGNRLYLGMLGGVAAIDLDRGTFVWKHNGLYDHATFRFNDFKRPVVGPVDVMFFENRESPNHISVNKQSGEMRVAGPYRWPIVRPFFSGLDASPAFYVECRNDTGRAISSADNRWAWAPGQLEIDEELFKPTGGAIGPGLSSPIEPGGIWNGIITLRQSASAVTPAVKFGAHVRSGKPILLSEGRHTIRVKCGERWSEPHVFYWEKSQ